MTVLLRDYDFAGARRRLIARVDRERRYVHDARAGIDVNRTYALRLLRGVEDVLEIVEAFVVGALCELPESEGGLVRDGVPTAAALAPAQPLARALVILGGHPKHEGYTHLALRGSGRAVPSDWKNTVHDAGPWLAAQETSAWSVAAFNAAVQGGVLAAYGSVALDPDRLVDEQAPGSKLHAYMRILAASALYDAIGGWDAGFDRAHALAGEWWLLQPVSPRLVFEEVAAKVGLEHAGFLPPEHTDVKGRVVMVCWARVDMPAWQRAEEIADTKWIAGWQRVLWTPGQPPLSDPSFELLEELEGVSASSYGPWKHSTELPPFRQEDVRWGPDGGAHARETAAKVLAALDAPEDANADALFAQDDRRKSKIAAASVLRTGSVAAKPPQPFAGPARTLDELRFAASLEHCGKCDDQIEPEKITLSDEGNGQWCASGTCPRCGEKRAYRYAANSDVATASHQPHELGEGPSRMITVPMFREALRIAQRMVAPFPDALEPEDFFQSNDANRRALICLNELVKLDEPPADRAEHLAERDRQKALREAHDKVS